MPITKSGKAHPLSLEQRQTLARQIDPSWGQSVRREVTLPVTERRTEPRVKHTNTGKRMVVPEKKEVEVQRTLDQEVLELPLIDAADVRVSGRGTESASDSTTGDEPSTPLVLNPEDVIGEMAPEPPAADTLEPDALDPARQSIPVGGLSKVLRSRSEGIIAVGEGEESRQVRYEGPRFEIRGSVLFDIEQPVDPSPKIPKIDEQGRPVVQQGEERFRAVQRIGPGRDYQYPEDQLADQVRQEGSSQ